MSVTDGAGRAVPAHGLDRWLVSAAPAGARGVVTIALVGDAAMRRLNREFRRLDYATDVLSFSSVDDALLAPATLAPAKPPRLLGEIVIATGVARRQALEAGHSEFVEHRVLALHGLLHLLGYDHETDDGQMQRAENRLRRKAGLPAGLITRAHRPQS